MTNYDDITSKKEYGRFGFIAGGSRQGGAA
jgi:hypothetical protein